MEVWLGQMGPVGSTANVLEAQIREQKVSNLNQTLNSFKVDIIQNIPVQKESNLYYHKFQSFHAEVHQYKSHIEDFNHLTQELISTYQTDDTAKIKKITEIINQR